jgi:DNA polymerase-3 subunit epsilon
MSINVITPVLYEEIMFEDELEGRFYLSFPISRLAFLNRSITYIRRMQGKMEIYQLKEKGFRDLPSSPGVYFFYDHKDNLVYIGKSIDIRKRVQQHFSGRDRKSVKIQVHVSRVSFEVTGSELIALLYESELIKLHQPLYNRSQRRTIYQYGLYRRDIDGYMGLGIERIALDEEAITSFASVREAKETLYRITEKYGLCQKVNGLYKTMGSCFQFQIKSCNGACLGVEHPSDYNARVEAFIHASTIGRFTQLFEVEGRDEDELGLVYIENGVYQGFGFCPKTVKRNKLHYIVPRQDNKDVKRILIRHLINS